MILLPIFKQLKVGQKKNKGEQLLHCMEKCVFNKH